MLNNNPPNTVLLVCVQGGSVYSFPSASSWTEYQFCLQYGLNTIHVDRFDRLCINSLPLEFKTQEQGRDELYWEIKISAADSGQVGDSGYSFILCCSAQWLLFGADLWSHYVLSGA